MGDGSAWQKVLHARELPGSAVCYATIAAAAVQGEDHACSHLQVPAGLPRGCERLVQLAERALWLAERSPQAVNCAWPGLRLIQRPTCCHSSSSAPIDPDHAAACCAPPSCSTPSSSRSRRSTRQRTASTPLKSCQCLAIYLLNNGRWLVERRWSCCRVAEVEKS